MLNINEQFRIDIKKTPFKFRVSDVGFEEDYGVRSIFHWLIRNFYRLSRYICFSELPFPNFFRLILSRFGHNWSGHRFFVARSLIDIINAKSVIDSSKDCIGMRELYENRQGVMKIIFLTRDPRANAWSYVKAGLDPIDATKRWVAVNLRIRRFLDRIPHGDWISIRYEDFCADPEAICRKLSAFLNLEYSPEMLLFSKKIHTIGGNKIRYTRVSEIRQDLSWLHSLPAATTSEINKLFGKEISLMGYNV